MLLHLWANYFCLKITFRNVYTYKIEIFNYSLLLFKFFHRMHDAVFIKSALIIENHVTIVTLRFLKVFCCYYLLFFLCSIKYFWLTQVALQNFLYSDVTYNCLNQHCITSLTFKWFFESFQLPLYAFKFGKLSQIL